MEIRQHETVGVVMSVDFFFFTQHVIWEAVNMLASSSLKHLGACMYLHRNTSCVGRHRVSFFFHDVVAHTRDNIWYDLAA